MLSIPIQDELSECSVPCYLSPVHAGFPSPAADYADEGLDFNRLLIHRKAATYCLRVAGESMIGAGILPDDILVVDRSLTPADRDIVVASLDGEFTVKRFFRRDRRIILRPENPMFEDIIIGPEENFSMFGVVTAVVRQYRGAQ